jgi:hypothetical protein
MTYHSKSPKEWEERDKIKNIEYKKTTLKRVSKVTGFLLIFVSLIALIFIFLGPRISRFDLSYSKLIDGLSFSLVCEDSFKYPDLVEFEILIQNTTNSIKSLKISNFSVKIFNLKDNEKIYEFIYNDSVETELIGYQKIPLFDITREKEIRELESSEYQIQVKFNFFDKEIFLEKNFDYSHDLRINFYSENQFFLEDELPTFVFTVSNQSKNSFNKNISGEIIIKKDKKNYFTQSVNFGSVLINSMESKLLNIPLEEKLISGTYDVIFNIDSLEKTIITNINILKEKDEDFKDLFLTHFTVSLFEINSDLYYTSYLNNSKKINRGIEITNLIFRVKYENDEIIFNYEKNDPLRAYLPSEGNVEVFDIFKIKKVPLNRTGFYEIFFEINVNGQKHSKTQRIEVQ